MNSENLRKVLTNVLSNHRELIDQECFNQHQGCSCGDNSNRRELQADSLLIGDEFYAYTWREHIADVVLEIVVDCNN